MIKLTISGMSCANCANAIERKTAKIAGVKSAKVDFASSRGVWEIDVGAGDLAGAANSCGANSNLAGGGGNCAKNSTKNSGENGDKNAENPVKNGANSTKTTSTPPASATLTESQVIAQIKKTIAKLGFAVVADFDELARVQESELARAKWFAIISGVGAAVVMWLEMSAFEFGGCAAVAVAAFVLACSREFLAHAAAGLRNGAFDMNTLIALGVVSSLLYSALALAGLTDGGGVRGGAENFVIASEPAASAAIHNVVAANSNLGDFAGATNGVGNLNLMNAVVANSNLPSAAGGFANAANGAIGVANSNLAHAAHAATAATATINATTTTHATAHATTAAHADLYFSAPLMIVFFVWLGRFLERRAKSAATRQVAALLNLAPKTATLASGAVVSTAALKVGDEFIVRSGESVAVDAVIVRGSGLFDASALTGESEPRAAAAGAEVFGGSVCAGGLVVARAQKPLAASLSALIADELLAISSKQSGAARLADRVARIFVPVVVAVAACTLVFWGVWGADFMAMFAGAGGVGAGGVGDGLAGANFGVVGAAADVAAGVLDGASAAVNGVNSNLTGGVGEISGALNLNLGANAGDIASAANSVSAGEIAVGANTFGDFAGAGAVGEVVGVGAGGEVAGGVAGEVATSPAPAAPQNFWALGALRAIAVLLISCPCALGLATPIALVCAISRASRFGVVVKSPQIFERLGGAKWCFFDKTMTLTSGDFEVSFCDLLPSARAAVLPLMRQNPHPLSRGFVRFCEGADAGGAGNFRENRAENRGKNVTENRAENVTENRAGNVAENVTENCADFVFVSGGGVKTARFIAGNRAFLVANGVEIPADISPQNSVIFFGEFVADGGANSNLADTGDKTAENGEKIGENGEKIGEKAGENGDNVGGADFGGASGLPRAASRARNDERGADLNKTDEQISDKTTENRDKTALNSNLAPQTATTRARYLGRVELKAALARGAREAVSQLQRAGLKCCIVSGDNAPAVRAIARELGIGEFYAGCLPQDKLRILREKGADAAVFVGDGINDALVLKEAAASFAVGGGSDLAKQSTDAVLLGADLRGVCACLRLSRRTLAVIRENLAWAFGYNALCIPLAAGAFAGWGVALSPMWASAAMSLSSLCVVCNSLRLLRAKI